MKKICQLISSMILVLLLLMYLPLTLPAVFGLHSSAVVSASMEPAIRSGGLVFYRGAEPASLQAGDVIVFRTSYGTDVSDITHRVVANDASQSLITTKGDANATEDFSPVRYDLVKGKVVAALPFGGNLSLFLISRPGKAAMLGLLIPAVLFRIALLRVEAEENRAKAARFRRQQEQYLWDAKESR